MLRTDIAIIGAGIAGASLAAAIGGAARCLLIEGEAQPGYHATGRSAAFWSETYGGPLVQPLTSASFAALDAFGVLGPRGCVHVATEPDRPKLGALAATMAAGGVEHRWLDRAALLEQVPGLRPHYLAALAEPSCRDIDVAALHAAYLRQAQAAGTRVLTDAAVAGIARAAGEWHLETGRGPIAARVVVNAAGAWAGAVARSAGALRIAIEPRRRTMVQLRTDPPAAPRLPLVMDAAGGFYFKPESGGRLWLSPHDETPVTPHDVAPEEIDVAIAIDRLERAVDWRVLARERAWAGLRSFAPDRLPVYGFDPRAPGFFWFAGQGGFGIQTAPAAAMIGAAALLGRTPDPAVAHIDAERYGPRRFASDAGIA